MLQLPPPSPLFPYTTLFRSAMSSCWSAASNFFASSGPKASFSISSPTAASQGLKVTLTSPDAAVGERSEEHTSELQSRQYLVCRLLLEKKKNTNMQIVA